MAGPSHRERKIQTVQFLGMSLTEILLIMFMLTTLCLAGFWVVGKAILDIQFNDGFNERAAEYFKKTGPNDPFLGLIARSMNACGEYSRVAVQMEIEKSKENTDTMHYRLHQAGRESFDACMSLHLTNLQSALKDDRLAVLQAGLECDKGCPMRVIQGLGPWKINPDARLAHFRGR